MQTMPANQTPEFKTWLKGLLVDENTKDLCVVFTKKDGTERELFCTLNESRIPSAKLPKVQESGSVVRNFSDESARVFDTEKQEWRSFRWDSVKQVRFELS
jgi:hypothetical protein